MPDVICIGEVLADFVPEGRGHVLRPGGAPANVAVNLARMGVSSGIITKTGTDPLGKFLKGFLRENRVNVSNVFTTNRAKTGLVLVFHDKNNESTYSFYGDPAADKFLDKSEIKPAYINTCEILHYGSISMMHPVSAAAVTKAVLTAKRNGALISYDPNVRLNLWKGRFSAAKKMMRGLFKYADIIKLNEKELKFLFGAKPSAGELGKLFGKGHLVFVTAGAKGCFVYLNGFFARASGAKARVVDATGAGDAFMAGVLSGIIKNKKGLELEESVLLKIAQKANSLGAAAVARKGAV